MRAIFFLNYRAGSTLFESLCGKEWRMLGLQGRTQEAIECANLNKNKPFYLPTIPPVLSEDISSPLATDKDNYAYITHIGDWWGQLPSKDIPGPYNVDSPASWSFKHLCCLQSDWKFVYLLRDGRNQIESLRNMKGGIEEQLNSADPMDYFKVLAKGFRNRARVALDCNKFMPDQYRIFWVEDLFVKPIETFTRMLLFAGFDPDIKSIHKYANEALSKNNHSSFRDTAFNKRWTNWTPEEKDTFKLIAGRELVELGYEKDNKW